MPWASLGPFSPSAHTPQAVWQTTHRRTAGRAALACWTCIIYQCGRAHTILPPHPTNHCHPYNILKIPAAWMVYSLPFPERSRVSHQGQRCQNHPPTYPCMTESIDNLRSLGKMHTYSHNQPGLVPLRWVEPAGGGRAQSQRPQPCSGALHDWHIVWALACLCCIQSDISGHAPRPGLPSNPNIQLHPYLSGHWTNRVYLIEDLCEHTHGSCWSCLPTTAHKHHRAILGVTDTLETKVTDHVGCFNCGD